MVNITTNRTEYQNDIAEMIRAYLGFVELQFVDEAADDSTYSLTVMLDETEGKVTASGRKAGIPAPVTGSYSFVTDHSSVLQHKKEEKRALKIALFRVMRELEPHRTLPWGALTGIRPTKLLRELSDTLGEEEAFSLFTGDFCVRQDKARLAQSIIDVQRPIFSSIRERELSVYIGIPYCRTKCLYCSFVSEVLPKNGVPQAYLDALFEDIALGAALAKDCGYTVRSTYIGGGTPTVLTAAELNALLEHLQNAYGTFGQELTVEAGRPDTIDKEKLAVLKRMGTTRISLNPQSMHTETLQRIGRKHTPADIVCAFRDARAVGFDNINMDIIVGLPGETITHIQQTLEQIADLQPDSLTVHTLAVKRSSRLKEQLDQYRLPEAEETEAMVAFAAQAASALGMRPYYMYRQKYMRGNLENIGYAMPGKDCIYNVDMMEEMLSILAHGAGAMTKRVFPGKDMRVERIPAPKDIATYIQKIPLLNAQKRALFLEN